MILALLSTVGGFIGFPHELGHELNIHHWLDNFLSTSVVMQKNEMSLNTELILMGSTVVLIVVMILLARTMFVSKQQVPESDDAPMPLLKEIVYHKYYVDEIYEAVIVQPLQRLSVFFYNFLERSGIDGVVNGIGTSVVNWSQLLRLSQTGGLGFYVIAMVVSIIALILLMFI
jgi:NADH-quinone oxidoreductase subunit L